MAYWVVRPVLRAVGRATRASWCRRAPSRTTPSQRSGMEIFLEFAAAVGAIGGAEKEELEGRNGRALGELAGRQAKYQAARDPALRFMALLPSRAGGRNGACGRPAGQSAGRGGRLGMAAPQDRPKMGVAGHAHRLGGGERLISGSPKMVNFVATPWLGKPDRWRAISHLRRPCICWHV